MFFFDFNFVSNLTCCGLGACAWLVRGAWYDVMTWIPRAFSIKSTSSNSYPLLGVKKKLWRCGSNESFLGFVIVPEYHYYTTPAPLPPPFLSSRLFPLLTVPLTSLTSQLLFFRSFSILSHLLFFFAFCVIISPFSPPVHTPSRFPLACVFVTVYAAYVIRSVVTCFLVSLVCRVSCVFLPSLPCLLPPLFYFFYDDDAGWWDVWWLVGCASDTTFVLFVFSPSRNGTNNRNWTWTGVERGWISLTCSWSRSGFVAFGIWW